ncbi:MAG: S8 family serine peptidase, partial [Phycisphaerae bacterium]
MATPTVSGLAALLLQDFRIQFPARPDLRNATLKALLIHNAQDITNPGPDYQSGYGSVRIQPTIDLLRLGDFLEDAVANLQTNTLFINVNPGDPQLKITLVWDDAPGTPNVDPALINNLDLVVTSPSMVQQFPWTLDPLNPALPAVRTQADTLNNVEQVVVDAPQAGLWRVDVVGTNVPVGPQGYSLTATPSLPGCVLPGTVSLDRQAYACDGTVMLEVADCDANINDAIVETVDVALTSVTEPAPGETVTLTETAAASGVFRGSIGLSPLDSAGVLHIVDGDTVTATYGTAAGDAVNGATLFLSPQPTNLGVSKACADCHGHDGSGNTAADIRGFSAAALAASAQGFVSHPAPVGRQDVKYPTLTAQDFNDMEAFLAVPSATGVVDCLEPVVFGVLTTNTGPQWTDVTFNTNESATSVVRYGLSCASLTQAAVESTPATVHTLTLTGLSELTTYFYTVDATDTAGNTVTDDNAGSCYAFSTTLAPDFFTERFQSADGDLDNLAITFVPNGSTNFYAACAESITVLPVDPIGGAALTLPDDGFATVTLGA